MSPLSEEDQFITVVDVRDYAYCPRVVYFAHVLHLRERVTEAMQYGKEQHEEPPLALLMLKLRPARIMRNVELTSHKLKLTGKIDMVVVTKYGEYVPVEVKWSEPKHSGKPRRQHKAQLTAYALLIEDNFKTTVKRAIIYYSRSRQLIEIPLTSQDKQQVKRYIQQIYEIIQDEEVPNIEQDLKQCQDCGYRPYCQSC